MKFNHLVNFNGKYYLPGQEVPIGGGEEKPAPQTPPKAKLTKKQLESMTVKKIRETAAETGISLTKTVKAEIIKEFLEKQ